MLHMTDTEMDRLERVAHLLPPHWFHPDRDSAQGPGELREVKESFRDDLQAIDRGLDLSWHPLRKCWQIWVRDIRVQSAWCRGWRRLFLVVDPEGNYRPLDQRTLAELALRDARFQGGATEALRRVKAEIAAAAEARRRRENAAVYDQAKDTFDFHKIKNIGSGRKFADHWSEVATARGKMS